MQFLYQLNKLFLRHRSLLRRIKQFFTKQREFRSTGYKQISWTVFETIFTLFAIVAENKSLNIEFSYEFWLYLLAQIPLKNNKVLIDRIGFVMLISCLSEI